MDSLLGWLTKLWIIQPLGSTIIIFIFSMTLTTLIIMGIVYLRFVMPDLVIIKHRRNKYITPNDSEGWKKYEV